MPRTAALTHGRTLTVRPAGPDDVDGLLGLYVGLSDDDLHRRFFSVFTPSRRFLEDWVAMEVTGGCCLVAVVTGEGAPPETIGDAGYARLEDGTGEFAMTVAPRWRGWLGPYLLDTLAEEAASRGVAALQADVLVENRRMLAVARARGCVTVGHPDWTVVRIMIGTTNGRPGWPDRHERPRILVEVPGGRWGAEEAARAAGFTVVTCAGPAAGRGRCPVLSGEPCPLAEGADVIVHGLRDDETGGAVLAGLRATRPEVPVVVQRPPARPGEEAPTADLLTTTPAEEVVAVLHELVSREAPR